MISPKASIYGNVKMGENVRIDDFVILTGNITIGNNCHIGCFSFFSGGEGIILEDYVQIAPRVTILSRSDDYSGNSLSGPTIPNEFKPFMDRGPILLRKHVMLGTGTIVMPNVVVGTGACTGAMTFVKHNLKPWGIYAGCPARYMKPRSKRMLGLQKMFERSLHGEDQYSGQD